MKQQIDEEDNNYNKQSLIYQNLEALKEVEIQNNEFLDRI